jgi:hypothetical protein
MTGSELFKFDVRIRERMLRKSVLSDADVAKHLDALPDLTGQCDEMPLRQPALHRPDDGAASRMVKSVPPPRPVPQAPAAPLDNHEGDDIDDDDWGAGT